MQVTRLSTPTRCPHFDASGDGGNMRASNLHACAAVFVLVSGCVGGVGGPDWVRTRRSKTHPGTEWLIGVGQGHGLRYAAMRTVLAVLVRPD